MSTLKDAGAAVEVRLAVLEEQIQRGLQSFYEAGVALCEIRDSKLYRNHWATFEDYCLERWRMSKIHAHRLMNASQTVEAITAIAGAEVRPDTEWQVRPLTQMEPEQAVEAWQAATVIGGTAQPMGTVVERAAKAVRATVVEEWGAGQVLTVKDGPDSGQVVTTIRQDGVIVYCEQEGEIKPYLRTELTEPGVVPVPIVPTVPDWTTRATKPDKLEALEAELQAAEARIELLEQMLRRLAMAAGPWVSPDLVAEVNVLLD